MFTCVSGIEDAHHVVMATHENYSETHHLLDT